MRRLLLVTALFAACASTGDDDSEDLGTVQDGKADGALIDVQITVNKMSTTTHKPGVRNFTVKASNDFDVALAYDGTQIAKIIVTNLDTDAEVHTDITAHPAINVSAGGGGEHEFRIRIENDSPATLHAHLTAKGHGGGAVTAELLAAARANLDRVTKEIDYTHLDSYGLNGTNAEQFLSALSAEYEHQHPDQYEARVKALASMAFFALPDVVPPAGGVVTPFHGLDMNQFASIMSIEDQVFSSLVAQNGGDTNGVRPFSVCETRFLIESYVRPKLAYPGFAAYKAAYTTYAASCPQKDKDEWYNFRGLGGLRPSWVESNLADRFLRRMAKNCQGTPTTWAPECAVWNTDRLGYRQLRNRQLAARTMYYAPADETYVSNPNNPLVFLEDRDGDDIGEFLRPGPATKIDGTAGTLVVSSTSQFAGNLKFVVGTAAAKTISPGQLNAEQQVDSRWNRSYLAQPDMGLLSVFSSSTGCTSASLDPVQCPLLKRFYSMIDRHENFYQTFSALTPTYYGISSQPSPLVACSITLGASHQWDAAGTPSGGTAGFIFLMRIPFADILTGNATSVATLMPGPKTLSLQSLYGAGHLDMTRVWLDVASLSNNQYETEHEISAFGVVPANEIEGILDVRKPAAVQ
ncbi:MAG: hypothetical protein ABI678_07690 [Kofleriaceae bacterium]